MRKQVLKYRFLVVIALFLFVVSGCTVRSYKVIKQRPDREPEGNRGYLSGQAPEDFGGKDTRTSYVWEVEFGQGGIGIETPQVIEEKVIEAPEETVEDVVYEAPQVIPEEDTSELLK